jgi:citrate lyase subunit beta / citryl-CoA lyase
MPILVRRSNLIIPVDASAVDDAWRCNADAITLALECGSTTSRDHVRWAIAAAGKGSAEVFVRVNKNSILSDLELSIWPGLGGIMLSSVETAADVTQASESVAKLESERGIISGSIQFIIVLETACGVWDIRQIVRASSRITQIALDEAKLAADLGIRPLPDLDPFEYARGRLTVEATAANVAAVGMAYPLSVQPRELPETEIHTLATKARNLGMKGVLCPYASWVAPVNAAFTPTPELVEWNRRVRDAFAAGVAAGTAAVPLDGKMIDVPVDEWAIVVLAMAEACSVRDTEKQAALSGIT